MFNKVKRLEKRIALLEKELCDIRQQLYILEYHELGINLVPIRPIVEGIVETLGLKVRTVVSTPTHYVVEKVRDEDVV